MKRENLAPGVFLNTLDAQKFNRCRITIHLRYPALRRSATDAAVLPLVLERGYAGCPDMTELSRKLARLYGADLGVDQSSAGIDRDMGLTCNVSSPTFAIVNVYGEHNELCHFDMYRVESWDDLYSTGFFDYIDMGSVLCVEWSENVENALPENTVRVYMEKGGSDNERIIRIDGVKDENSLC